MIGMHMGILLIVDFADLTMGMLMIHWFTFDSSWLSAKPKDTGIVYFDGVCGLCNNFVNVLLSEDRKQSLQFAPLQGVIAKENIDAENLEKLDTVMYQENGKIYTKSDAVIMALASLGGHWKLGIVFRIIPKFIRDFLYSYIARHRYKWFGKNEECRIPTAEERSSILL